MRYIDWMRTTLTIDDDVLNAARILAKERGQSVGKVISDLARDGLGQPATGATHWHGLPLLPRRGGVVTTEMVNALLDEEDLSLLPSR